MAKRKTKKFKGLHNLSAGLFGYRGWYWYKNIGDLWILINRVFGKLTVIRRIDSVNKRALWECKCECGNTCYMPSRYLLSMNVKSCGCDTKSYGELFVREQLQFYNYKFKEQYTFLDCLSPKK